MKKSTRLFTLYAKEDEYVVEELTVHLSRLRRMELISHFSDKDISPIDTWDDKTWDDFETCDYLLFIVTPALLRSGYLREEAIRLSFEAAEQGMLSIVPILLRPCDLGEGPLSKWQVLPANKQAIDHYQWENRGKAWNATMNGLKSILQGEEMPAHNEPELVEEKPFTQAAAPSSAPGKKRFSLAVQLAFSLVALSAMAGVTYKVSSSENLAITPRQIVEVPKKRAQTVVAVPRKTDIEKDYDEASDEDAEDFIPQWKKTFSAYAAKKSESLPTKDVVDETEDPFYEPEILPVPKKMGITSRDLSKMLYNFSQGKGVELEFGPFLCNDLNTEVIFEKKKMTFQEMCNEIRKTKSRKIKKIEVSTETEPGGCISAMTVDLKKRWF